MTAAAEDWTRLSAALRALHRALVARARVDYAREKLVSDDLGPVELLHLLTGDPWFAWLRELSELMVDIDVIQESDAGDEMAGAARAAVEYFVTPPRDGETPHAFAGRYWTYVQEDPDVAIAHAQLKRAVSAFPAIGKRERAALWAHRVRLGDVARQLDVPVPRTRQ